MNRTNALAGLIGSYGESGDESDEGTPAMTPAKKSHMLASESEIFQNAASAQGINTGSSATIHPAPIPHCQWSACYDETSGFTYYWNQHTNAVTWEAPPEYLLALKLAQQQLHSVGSAEVTAKEWQLYQQALIEKQQSKVIAKPAAIKKPAPTPVKEDKNSKQTKKRFYTDDDEEEKIELITSYHNSDSESDHEPESPKKKATIVTKPATPVPVVTKPQKNPHKKAKTKPLEYGPILPANQNYSLPIGPEMPSELVERKPKVPVRVQNGAKDKAKSETEDSQDENTLFKKLRDKAKLLEKLGGELPSGLEKIIREEDKSGVSSPALSDGKKSIDIDDLLEEIEKKELPKVAKAKLDKKTIDIFDDDTKSSVPSPRNSPKSGILTPIKSGTNTPIQALFPSSKNIDENTTTLCPSVVINEDPKHEETEKDKSLAPSDKANVYLSESTDTEKSSRKKFRISNSVLPERKRSEPVSYTTKYSQHIEGFSTERVGLGFTQDLEEESPKCNVVSYGKGLMFTKGETLNEEKKDEDLEDLTELVEAKLKYLNAAQPAPVAPVQEMWIQMQTLVMAYRCGGLAAAYWRRWARAAQESLAALERAAAPPGWRAAFQRAEGRYKYVRDADGLEQWEYPAVDTTDMDICTTPPHPGIENKEEAPPLPRTERPVTPPPPPLARVPTPPPPAWSADPPPPGCDDLPPLPPEPKKHEISAELMSFYSDIADLEKQTSTPPATVANSPEHEPRRHEREWDRDTEEMEKEKERDRDKDKTTKKKSKVKISTSMGVKHRSVSNMVAKWQQVADEIHSD